MEVTDEENEGRSSRSDATTTLERDRDFREEQFDFVQQSLRTTCLRYGASLFYTSTHHPDTLENLRAYVLDRLLAPRIFVSPQLSGVQSLPAAPVASPKPYAKKAQVVERDTVFVPSGWDSWGKIRVLREGFDCEAMGADARSDTKGINEDPTRPTAIYESVIRTPAGRETSTMEPATSAEQEQAFLERHLELLQSTVSASSPSTSEASKLRSASSSSSASLAAAAPLDDVAAKLQKLSRAKEASSTNLGVPVHSTVNRERLKSVSAEIPLPASVISSNAVSRAAGAIGSHNLAAHSQTGNLSSATGAPGGAGGAGTGPPASQNEVLANFFQSLLAKKTSIPGGSGGSPPPPPSAGVGSGAASSTGTSGGGGGGGGRGAGGGGAGSSQSLPRPKKPSSSNLDPN
ncbi:hypothetical protein HKX48_008320 [Thoreauomyces humboldtii]|nr:hypothetical protein HKX48_008320 [Thoreauomyces humboldtii]